MGIHGARALAMTLAAVLLAGCSGTGDAEPRSKPSESSTSSEEPASEAPSDETSTDAEAESEEGDGWADDLIGESGSDETLSQRELDEFILNVPRSVDWGYELKVAGQPFIATAGTWIAPGSWASRTRVYPAEGGEPTVMNNVSIQREQWMQMESWPKHQRGCWLSLPLGKVPVGFQFLLPRVPVPLMVVDQLTSTEDGYAVNFNLTSGLLTLDLIKALRLKRQARSVMVPVEVVLGEDMVERVTVQGRNILDATDLDPAVADEAVDSMEQMEFVVTLAPGRSFDVVRPPERKVVPYGRTHETCGRTPAEAA
jgi:hypothetical protein